jgi:hypothetical protein
LYKILIARPTSTIILSDSSGTCFLNLVRQYQTRKCFYFCWWNTLLVEAGFPYLFTFENRFQAMASLCLHSVWLSRKAELDQLMSGLPRSTLKPNMQTSWSDWTSPCSRPSKTSICWGSAIPSWIWRSWWSSKGFLQAVCLHRM